MSSAPEGQELVAGGGAARLPGSGQLLHSFADDPMSVAEGVAPPLAIAHQLARQHEHQWNAEDLCRSPIVSDEVLGRVKRRIDALNDRRVELIDRLDQWVGSQLRQDPHAVPHTETYGMIVDRMAISWVRVRKMSASLDGQRPLTMAKCQLSELALAYDALIAEVETRRRSLPVWRPLKFYQGSATVAPEGAPKRAFTE
jgi:hypothetical protein